MPLKVQVVAADPLETKSDLVVFGVHEGNAAKDPALASLHRAFGGGLAELLTAQEWKGKKEQALLVPTLGRLPSASLLLLGLGKEGTASAADIRVFGALAARRALAEKATALTLVIPIDAASHLRALAEGVVLGSYRFTKYLTGDRKPKKELARVAIVIAGKKKLAGEQKEIDLGVAVGDAVNLARDLQNEPPNELTPKTFAEAAQKVAKEKGLKVTVLDKKGLERAGMKLFVAVGQGSVNEPRLVHLSYVPAKKAKKKIVVVGKGLTFDSGGISIKPAAGMGDMKTDMSGAANVLALLAAVAAVKPDVEVHGILGCAENMPDAGAYRPGDIFGSLDGKTVEIINTDAEGRLVLADCLAYARKLKADVIVDQATLTGACIVALGNNCSGFYSTTESLGTAWAEAAKAAGEQFWRMPLLDDLRDQLKSDCADLKHTGDRAGGSITAALFLREFVGDSAWIHCDIAGPSLATRANGIYPKGGTGHGMLTLLEFIQNGTFSLATQETPTRRCPSRPSTNASRRSCSEASGRPSAISR